MRWRVCANRKEEKLGISEGICQIPVLEIIYGYRSKKG
jgi:hypothetical protein